MPLPPPTTRVTVSACIVLMLEDDRVTVSEGVAFITVTLEEAPVAPL
jgi:hypothetical protein